MYVQERLESRRLHELQILQILNVWDPDQFTSDMSQTFRLFRLCKLSVLNFRF